MANWTGLPNEAGGHLKPAAWRRPTSTPPAELSLHVFSAISNATNRIAKRLLGHAEFLSPISDLIVLRKVDQFAVLPTAFGLVVRHKEHPFLAGFQGNEFDASSNCSGLRQTPRY